MDGAGGGAPGWNAEAAARPISARPPAVSRCPAPRTPPHPPCSARALELLRRFPARARVTLRGLLPKPTPPALPTPLPEPTAPGKLSVPLHELPALEGGGGKKKPTSHPFLWGWFLHKPVFYFKACLKKK